VEEIEIQNSAAFSRISQKRISFGELGKIAYRLTSSLPPGMEPELEEYGIFDTPSNMNVVSYGCHGAVVQLDPETGGVRVKKYFVVDDAGVIVNPVSAEAQVHGSVISQGFFQSFNELIYDKDATLVNSSFMDYGPPTSCDCPEQIEIENLVTPSLTPGGFKGLGEGGAVGCPAALVNAISDSLSAFGGSMNKLPMSLVEIWGQANK